MQRRVRVLALALAGFVVLAAVAYAAGAFNRVTPREFDPAKSHLVQADWLAGIGCPTDAKAQVFQPPDFSTTARETVTDPACATGDPRDNSVQGLLLAKTGPTANNASATARLENVPSHVTELGYDIRKPGTDTSAGPRGSHCGAGAPRFDIVTRSGHIFFIGCNSPPATTQTPGTGFIRLRWDGTTLAFPQSATDTPAALSSLDVRSITIVFDEGQDASGAPDQFGVAILDNVDVNGVLVGRGSGNGDDNDDQGEHDDD
jgi:hypothetical protein